MTLKQFCIAFLIVMAILSMIVALITDDKKHNMKFCAIYDVLLAILIQLAF